MNIILNSVCVFKTLNNTKYVSKQGWKKYFAKFETNLKINPFAV